jgi:hypothetical protein
VLSALACVAAACPATADPSETSSDPMRNLLKRAEQDYRLGTAEGLVERLRPAAAGAAPEAQKPKTAPSLQQPPIATLPPRIPVQPANAPASLARPAPPDTAAARVPPAPQAAPPRNAALIPAEAVKQSPAASEVLHSVSPGLPVIPAREIEAGPRAPPVAVADPPVQAKPSVADPPAAAQAETRKPTPAQCRNILERAQIGAAGPSEMQLLRAHCR